MSQPKPRVEGRERVLCLLAPVALGLEVLLSLAQPASHLALLLSQVVALLLDRAEARVVRADASASAREHRHRAWREQVGHLRVEALGRARRSLPPNLREGVVRRLRLLLVLRRRPADRRACRSGELVAQLRRRCENVACGPRVLWIERRPHVAAAHHTAPRHRANVYPLRRGLLLLRARSPPPWSDASKSNRQRKSAFSPAHHDRGPFQICQSAASNRSFPRCSLG